MKKTVIILLFLFAALSQSVAQYILETPDGKTVKLNTNGTWEYMKPANAKAVKSNPNLAKYLSRFKKFSIAYDPVQWVCDTTKLGTGLSWDATFTSTDDAINGYCMESRLTISLENLENTVREQWKDAGEFKDFKSFKDTLNKMPVTIFDMILGFGEVDFKYRGYVYSSLRGSFQFIVGTQKEVFEEDENKIEELIKGFIKN